MRGSLSINEVGTATSSFSFMEGDRLVFMNASERSYLLIVLSKRWMLSQEEGGTTTSSRLRRR